MDDQTYEERTLLDPSPRKASKQEGRQFGPEKDRYEIVKQLGTGGQAKVFSCKRLRYGNVYAAKIFDISEAPEHSLKMLRREIRNMRELCHPNIVNLIESFDVPYDNPTEVILVMDFAAGGDLHTKIEKELAASKGRTFPGLGGNERCSKYVVIQLLDAVGYMHKKHIMHRDLKLENVLISRSRIDANSLELHDVKISDLGFSKHIQYRGLARTASTIGTPGFAAPEVYFGEYDERADFWSFGVILYLMLCGQYPFRCLESVRSADRYAQLVAPEKIEQCESWNAAADSAKLVVMGLLRIDPDQRFGIHECLHSTWLETDEAEYMKHKVRSEGGFKRISSIKSGTAVVKRIGGRMGGALDSIEMDLSNGAQLRYGGSGGEVRSEVFLQEEELILAVMQEQRSTYLGTGLVFYTSLGRVICFCGKESQRRARFATTEETEIVGLQFQGSLLIGIHVADAMPGKVKSVEQIRGRVGTSVDEVVFKLRNGGARTYPVGGSTGGRDAGSLDLEKHEYVFALEQLIRDAYLGRSIVFYTSEGRVKSFAGMEASASVHFAVPNGRQICGLSFQGSTLKSVVTCPWSGDLTNLKTELILS